MDIVDDRSETKLFKELKVGDTFQLKTNGELYLKLSHVADYNVYNLAEDYMTYFNELDEVNPVKVTIHISPNSCNNNSQWISVEDMLPEVKRNVLVYCPKNKNLYTAYIDHSYKWHHYAIIPNNDRVTEEVTYWMPLPQPPVE